MCRRVVAAALVLGACAAAAGVLASGEVTVVTKQITFEHIHTLTVNSSIEYILQLIPTDEEAARPTRLWVSVEGGDTTRPLLLTARQRTGAITWQLPYFSGSVVLRELERTLCPPDSALADRPGEGDCDPEGAGGQAAAAGAFSLHVGTSCAGAVRVRLRAHRPARWELPFDERVSVTAVQGGPAVQRYLFAERQDSVRLVVQSADDVCATVAVQNYTCPIAETLEDIETSALRMTVLSSGGAQLSRRRYPRGFYVIAVVHEDDSACRAKVANESDWLIADVILNAFAASQTATTPQRTKQLTLLVKAALTRGQYAVGVTVSLAVFLGFYVAFGLAVLAQRLPACARLVRPRAVLAPKAEENGLAETERAMSSTPGRRRRESTATFDSSDNSDSESSDEEPRTPNTEVTVATITTDFSGASSVGPRADANGGGVNISNEIYTVDQGAGQVPNTPHRKHSGRGGGGCGGRGGGGCGGRGGGRGRAAVRAAGAAARGGAGAAARARGDGALRPLPPHALHRGAVLRAARRAVRGRLPADPERFGLAGHVLLQLPVRASAGRTVGLQPRVLQRGLPAAGRALHAAGAPPPQAPRPEAAPRGVRHPGALRAAVVAGRRHDGGGAAVRHLPRVPQRTQLPVRHGVHVRAGGAEHGEDLPGAAPRHQRARARHLRRAGRAHRAGGVGRAGRRAAVLEPVHHSARVLRAAAVAQHLLRGAVPLREGEPAAGGARAALAAAVHGAPRHAAHRQRVQLGARALRTVHAERGLREPPAERAAVQHAAVHDLLHHHEAAARGAHALVRVGLPGGGGGVVGAGRVLLPVGQHGLGGHGGAVPRTEPRVPRAAVLRRARPVAHAVGRRALRLLQRAAHVGRRPSRRQAHRHCRLLNGGLNQTVVIRIARVLFRSQAGSMCRVFSWCFKKSHCLREYCYAQ